MAKHQHICIIFVLNLLYPISSCHKTHYLKEIKNPLLPVLVSDNCKLLSHHHQFIITTNLSGIQSFLSANHTTSNLFIPPTVEEIEQEFKKLTLHQRQKRGLFNFIGTIQKQLYGTLDDDDLQNINAKMNILLSNEHKIALELNNQVSIMKNTSLLLQKNLDHFLQEYYPNKLLNLIKQINEAVNLAHHGIMSNYILNYQALQEIEQKLNILYPKEQIPEFHRSDTLVSLIFPKVIIQDLRLMIICYVPILNKKRYQYYQLYPIPIQQEILVPFSKYLLLSEENDYTSWTNEDCLPFEGQTICSQVPTKKTNDTCFKNLLQDKPYQCYTTPVSILDDQMSIIQNQLILIIPKNTLIIQENCPDSNPTKIYISKPSEIFPGDCSYLIKGDVIKLSETTLDINPIHFPQLDFYNQTLQDISHLRELTSNLQIVSIDDFPTEVYSFNYLWLLLLVIPIGLVLWILCKKPAVISRLWIKMDSATSSVPKRSDANQPPDDMELQRTAHPF